MAIHRQAHYLLADGQAAGLGGIQGRKLHPIAIGFSELMHMGHQGRRKARNHRHKNPPEPCPLLAAPRLQNFLYLVPA